MWACVVRIIWQSKIDLHETWAHTESNGLTKAYVFLHFCADIICLFGKTNDSLSMLKVVSIKPNSSKHLNSAELAE